MPGDESLGRLGSEVAEEHDERVAAGLVHIRHGGEHVLLVLHRDRAFVQSAAADLDDGGAALFGKRNGEAIAGNGNDAELDFGNVLHVYFPPLIEVF